jgi:hypothetical protein
MIEDLNNKRYLNHFYFILQQLNFFLKRISLPIKSFPVLTNEKFESPNINPKDNSIGHSQYSDNQGNVKTNELKTKIIEDFNNNEIKYFFQFLNVEQIVIFLKRSSPSIKIRKIVEDKDDSK